MAEQKAEVTAAMEAPVHERLYEAAFLISQGVAADFAGVIEHINEIFRRASAEVIAMKKWDERRLAYEIDTNKRGVYLLAFSRCDPVHVVEFERLCNLSESILRVMVTSAEHLTDEEMTSQEGRQEMAMEANLRSEQAPA